MKKKTGFTLIELLVVIAIIGILSGIVLVSLGGAKDRANDARIASDMGQLRTAAEIAYQSDGDYDCVTASDSVTTGCPVLNSEITTLKNDMNTTNGTKTNLIVFRDKSDTESGATKYCAKVELNSGKWYCVDNSLNTKQYDTQALVDAKCAATLFVCN